MQITAQHLLSSLPPIPMHALLSSSPGNRYSLVLQLRPLNQSWICISTVTCAKSKNSKNKGFSVFGSQRSRKSLLQLAHFVASNFSILPEPMNLLIREFGIGNGGGWSGFGKGFGWGDFDGEDGGWRRKRSKKKRKLWVWGSLVLAFAFSIGFLSVLGKDGGSHKSLLLGSSCCFYFIGGLLSSFPQWVLGFLSGALFVCLVLGKERNDLVQLLQRCRKGFLRSVKRYRAYP